MARTYHLNNTGWLGGDISIAERRVLLERYIRSLPSHDFGARAQCRCGGTTRALWRKRWHCTICGRWVRKFAHHKEIKLP